GAGYLVTRAGRELVARQKLRAAGAKGAARAGDAVALAGDGSVAVLGAPIDDAGNGAVYLFGRSPLGWGQRQELSLAGASLASGAAALSVAASANGSLVVVGTPYGSASDGVATVFVRDGGRWTARATLRPSAHEGAFGWSVAVSRDGSTILVGAPNDG